MVMAQAASSTANGAVSPNNASQVTIPPQLQSQIDLLISLHLWSWPALTLAIQNAWGGSAQVSADKRDWFAGAVSELVTSTPPQILDVDDLEEVLLNVMLDEFEVVVDDGSAEETARAIWRGLNKLRNGDLVELEEMYKKWQVRQGKGVEKVVGFVRGADNDGEETDWDDDDEDEEEWNGFADESTMNDVEMSEAPAVPKVKIQPEIDEDGFTKVVSKKKR